MASCSSCSAPLPSETCRCSYCGTRNDMDFAAVTRRTVAREESHRQCPDCAVGLQTVHVHTGSGVFAIERCARCFGLFFDVGEAQAFLDASVSPSFSVNLREIAGIGADRGSIRKPVRYVKCPECGVLMNRVNYASRSGVIVDQCRNHGMWLDNGELIHLMEWKKAGGEILAERQEKRWQEELQRENRRAAAAPRTHVDTGYAESSSMTGDILSTACSILLDALFRTR